MLSMLMWELNENKMVFLNGRWKIELNECEMEASLNSHLRINYTLEVSFIEACST